MAPPFSIQKTNPSFDLPPADLNALPSKDSKTDQPIASSHTDQKKNLEDFKKLTQQVQSLGLSLEGLIDSNGKVIPEKMNELSTRLRSVIQKMEKSGDVGSVSRFLDKAVQLDPNNKTLRLEAIGAKKSWADKENDPKVKGQLYQEAYQGLDQLLKLKGLSIAGLNIKTDEASLNRAIGVSAYLVGEEAIAQSLLNQSDVESFLSIRLDQAKKQISEGHLTEGQQALVQLQKDYQLFLKGQNIRLSVLLVKTFAQSKLLWGQVYDRLNLHEKAVESYQEGLAFVTKAFKKYPEDKGLYQISSQLHHLMQEYQPALSDLQKASASKEELEAYKKQLSTLLVKMEQNYKAADLKKDQVESFVYLTECIRLNEALGNSKAVEELSEKLAPLTKSLLSHEAVAGVQKMAEQGLISTDRLQIAKKYVSIKSDEKGIRLEFNASFESLNPAEKAVVLQELQQNGLMGSNKAALAKETDPTKKLYYEAKIEMLEGHLERSELKLRQFKKELSTSKSQDPEIQSMLVEA
ncbi:MAG: hypothetical protein JNK65_06390, partial [Deltaproteobacteria bacterium]|nr:hypothetical protein [Deltaproteobacteria bacterium]